MDDRDVLIKGDELLNKNIDMIVSGGIGCIESPKIIRELRRYGAHVRVWLTAAAQGFVNPKVFEWASKNSVITDLTGAAEHISRADLAIISPCSLDFMVKLSLGVADSPSLTCLQSILARRPIFIQPSMHESLAQGPAYQSAKEKLKVMPQVFWLSPKHEESKLKMPSAEEIVNSVCHVMNKREEKVFVLFGATESSVDAARFLGNRSSGLLGSKMVSDLYRQGFDVTYLKGSSQFEVPEIISGFEERESKKFFERALEMSSQNSFDAIICAAAILDFQVSEPVEHKIESKEDFILNLRVAPKLIHKLRDRTKTLVGFKLEVGLTEQELELRIQNWNEKKQCDFVIGNRKEDVNSHHYRACVLEAASGDLTWVEGREAVVKFLREKLKTP
jgi:phosphopantothenoylcysteine decarboxylase/phosphopantothenate--cysteine ligase